MRIYLNYLKIGPVPIIIMISIISLKNNILVILRLAPRFKNFRDDIMCYCC